MLHPNLSAIRAMLVLLHIQSLLSESFCLNLAKDEFESNQIKKSSTDSLTDSKSLVIFPNSNLDLSSISRSSELTKESDNLFNNLNSNFVFRRINKRTNSSNTFDGINEISDLNSYQNISDSRDVPSLNVSYYEYIRFFSRILYGAVCIVGLCGNSLVIYVVLRFSKMQTVTNMYILNLAFADEMFLFGLPFLIVTITYNYWAFGWIMCKIYMIITSINQFTSSLLLTVMSADRYIAVCHPISSPRYRTPCIAKIICLSVWTLSAYLMIPIFIFADVQVVGTKKSCNIYWPELLDNFKGQQAFTIYSFTLGFFIPLMLILLFYFLVICKLRTISTKHKSREKKKTQKKVTYLVLVVITVYISCWLPYWISQVYITFQKPDQRYNEFTFTVMLLAGCLSYANSAVNPILYAFLSENFKKSFAKAFTCATNMDVNAQLHGENSVFPQHLSKGKPSSSSKVETASTYLDLNQRKIKKKPKTKTDKNKIKDPKKLSQLTNLSSKLILRKNKRLSLDLSTQANRLTGNESNEKSQTNIDNTLNEKLDNKLNLTQNKDELLLNELDKQNKKTLNNESTVSSIKIKQRRKSEPKILISNGSNQQTAAKNRRRSTIISNEEDIETARYENEESSCEDDDEIVYESGEEDEYYDDDSSLNSDVERNCSAMPASLKARFNLKPLNRKSNNSKRKTSTTSLELGKASTTLRKISLVSKDSETSQIKKSNKLFKFMNKLTYKSSESKIKEEQAMLENNKRPENRISRKRISKQEAEHHRFGNLRRIQLNMNLECEYQNKSKVEGETLDHCLNNSNNISDNSEIKSENCLDSVLVLSDELSASGNIINETIVYNNNSIANNDNNSSNLIKLFSNDKNNNFNNTNFQTDNERLTEEHFSIKNNCSTNNCSNNKTCESIDCAQCSKCLKERGILQTQL